MSSKYDALKKFGGRTQRQLRVGEEVRHMLANIFMRGNYHIPDLSGKSITVSEVRVSPDLRHATAFVLTLGGEDMDVVLATLKKAAPYIRSLLAKEMVLKVTPELHFHKDESFDQGYFMEELLRSVHPKSEE